MNNTFIPESLNQTIGHWDINVGAILVIAQVAAPQAAGRIQDSPLQGTASSSCINLLCGLI